MKISTLIATMLVTATITLGSCSSHKPFATVGVGDFDSIISRQGTQLVDVRTPSEFLEGHIKNAQNIDVEADDFAARAMAKLDKRDTVAVYCRSGRRSAAAAQQLVGAGFKRVVNLDGGIIAWQVAGKPVVAVP